MWDFSRPIIPLKRDLYSKDVKEDTETILVQAALNGDTDSFNRLCERYYSAMVAIAYSRLCDRDLAEDAAQEAFFVAFCDISKLKKTGRFGRWLAAICSNIASDMAKARTRNKLIPIQDCRSSKNENEQHDNIEIVRNIISGLPVKMKEVIYLRYYNQMSYQQITNVLGISQEAVNGRLRRAKKIIAKELLHRISVEVNL